MTQHGDSVAGKKIVVIHKDVGGIAPDVAKRLAQELVVHDGVDVLAGFIATPNALAASNVTSPRGPISIDPATRDIVQTIYIREVRKDSAGYRNAIIGKITDVKDPVLERLNK
jgi:ABC-type branched-subunit amino acid transport system substrate-binding protein